MAETELEELLELELLDELLDDTDKVAVADVVAVMLAVAGPPTNWNCGL